MDMFLGHGWRTLDPVDHNEKTLDDTPEDPPPVSYTHEGEEVDKGCIPYVRVFTM